VGVDELIQAWNAKGAFERFLKKTNEGPPMPVVADAPSPCPGEEEDEPEELGLHDMEDDWAEVPDGPEEEDKENTALDVPLASSPVRFPLSFPRRPSSPTPSDGPDELSSPLRSPRVRSLSSSSSASARSLSECAADYAQAHYGGLPTVTPWPGAKRERLRVEAAGRRIEGMAIRRLKELSDSDEEEEDEIHDGEGHDEKERLGIGEVVDDEVEI
jgi:hypothetical protein